MRYVLTVLLAWILIWVADSYAEETVPTVFYVAPTGSDDWDGRHAEVDADAKTGPFQTLHRAQEAVRSAGAAQGALVYVREGTYYLEAPLVFGPEDSGTEGRPVTWQSFPGETAKLVAGYKVENFIPHEGAVVKADCSGFLESGERFFELYAREFRMKPARWPNAAQGDLPDGHAVIAGPVAGAEKKAFRYLGDVSAPFTRPDGIEVSIWPNHNWWQTIAAVAEVDTETRTVTLAQELPYPIKPGRRFYFQHVLEELDMPSEWYYDAESQTLYFWPLLPLDSAAIVIPRHEHVLKAENAAFLNFIGLTLEASRGDAVLLQGCSNVLLARSMIRAVGGHGVKVEAGDHVRVQGNDIYETGRSGIRLAGGLRESLTPAEHQAVNNHIYLFGREFKTFEPGVHVSGVGNRVAHNLIHDGPHMGVWVDGNEHWIEYNDIYGVCEETAGSGAIYLSRDWTERGNVIRYNRIHDVFGYGLAESPDGAAGIYQYERPYEAWGVHLDDAASGATVFGNVIFRVPLGGVVIGGGRDNVVANNIFVGSAPALHIDDRWEGFSWDLLQRRMAKMKVNEAPYSESYPELAAMSDGFRRPANNAFFRNVIQYTNDDYRGPSSSKPEPESALLYHLDQFDPGTTLIDQNVIDHDGRPLRIAYSAFEAPGRETLSWEDWLDKGYDASSVQVAPKFVAPEDDNFQLWDDSAAFDYEFKRIPRQEIGLYKDEFRASWPPPPSGRRSVIEHQRFAVEVPAP